MTFTRNDNSSTQLRDKLLIQLVNPYTTKAEVELIEEKLRVLGHAS